MESIQQILYNINNKPDFFFQNAIGEKILALIGEHLVLWQKR